MSSIAAVMVFQLMEFRGIQPSLRLSSDRICMNGLDSVFCRKTSTTYILHLLVCLAQPYSQALFYL